MQDFSGTICNLNDDIFIIYCSCLTVQFDLCAAGGTGVSTGTEGFSTAEPLAQRVLMYGAAP